jgi:hypothetical protein
MNIYITGIIILVILIVIIFLFYLSNRNSKEPFINKYIGPTEFSKLDTDTQNLFLKDCLYHNEGVSNEIDRRPFGEGDLNVPIYLRKCMKYDDTLCPIWNKKMIDDGLNILSDKNQLNKNIEPIVYPESARDILNAITKFPIKGLNVLTIGSISPWIETLLIYSHANVTVTDYNTPIIKSNIPNLHTIYFKKYKS